MAAACTVKVSGCVAVPLAPSVTATVNVVLPAVVGVPLSTPPDDSVKPFGSVPDFTCHVSEPVPPLAWSVWL